MKRIVLTAAFLLSLTVLSGFSVFGQRGFMHMVRLRQEVHLIESSNEMLRQENGVLQSEIGLLKHDLKYIEEVARKELGLVRQEELIYRVDKK